MQNAIQFNGIPDQKRATDSPLVEVTLQKPSQLTLPYILLKEKVLEGDVIFMVLAGKEDPEG